jgi:pimeloyl-ACP methyl ester carboxylesterase
MAKWITGTCEANRININYLRTGGDKPPVVLLHGLMLNAACWTPLARALEGDYEVEFVQIAKTSHAIPYDQPERFATIVKTFLRAVSA